MRIINSILFLTIVFQILSNGQTELAGSINSTWSNNWNLNSYEGILLGRFLGLSLLFICKTIFLKFNLYYEVTNPATTTSPDNWNGSF